VGSYSSALERELKPASGEPPTMSTLPLSSKVVLCPPRAATIGPVFVHVPAAGSYSSQVAVWPLPVPPPAASTSPLGNTVAVCRVRPVASEPVAVHVPLVG